MIVCTRLVHFTVGLQGFVRLADTLSGSVVGIVQLKQVE